MVLGYCPGVSNISMVIPQPSVISDLPGAGQKKKGKYALLGEEGE